MPFVRFSVDEGLSQSSVQAVVQDHQGFLWFGTEEGLNRFDGYRFHIFRHDPNVRNSLPDNAISALFEDSRHRLWIGTQQGLCVYNAETQGFTAISQVYDRITGIVETADGTLWMSSQGGGLYLKPAGSDSFSSYLPDARYPWDSLSSFTLSAVYLDRQGRLWLASREHGLDRFVPGKPYGKFVHYRHDPNDPDSLPSNDVWGMAEDARGNLVIATYGAGLAILDVAMGRFRSLRAGTTGGPSTDLLTAAYAGRDGTVWLGTDGAGVLKYNSQSGQIERVFGVGTDREAFAQAVVRSLYEDRQGHLWIGTYQSGVVQLAIAHRNFGFFAPDPVDSQSLSTPSVASALQDKAGRIWVGTERGVLNRFDPGTGSFVHYALPGPGGATRALMVLHEDHRGRIWVGTYGGGLLRFDGAAGQFHPVGAEARLANSEIWALEDGPDDTLWVGTNGGVDLYDPGVGRVVRHLGPQPDKNLGELSIRSLHLDRTGTLWVGSFGGLAALPPQAGSLKHYRHDPTRPESLSNDVVVAIRSDEKGRIWVGTLGGGLDQLDPATDRFQHFDQFSSHSINALEADQNGDWWLGTNHGLVRFDPVHGRTAGFDLTNGLQSLQFHLGASVRLHDGRLIFGSTDGFYLFDPAQIRPDEFAPPVLITDLRALNRSVPVRPHGLELKASDKLFSIEFAALDYNFPRRNRYQYWLEGLTRDWVDLHERREVSLTNLAPGSYRLKVRASNSDGLWQPGSSTELSFRVLPPPWATWWFRTAAALGIVGLIFLAHRARVSSLRHALVVRQESERVLQEAEEKYRELVESIGDVIFSTDEVGGVTYISPVVESLLGYRPEELTGRPVSQLLGQAGWKAIESTFWPSAPVPNAPLEREVQSKTGETHTVRISLRRMLEDGEVVGVRGVLTDVSELKRMETHLRQSQKMDAIGQLAGGIAHDFNNLLTAIIGFADLLKGRKLSVGARATAVEEILAASERAANLTQQLLAFSRQQALALTVLNLNALLADLEKMLQRLIGANILLVLSLDPELGMVRGDEGQMQQIILNLVVNARDAMAEGGRVLITTANHVDSKTGAASVVLSVRDNGVGMTAAVRARLFEPFFTTKEVGKGTGLGLSTVYGIVRQSGGRIEVESTPGLGAVFSVYLPRCDAPRQPAASEASASSLPAEIGTVLVVDDNESVVRIVTEILLGAGVSVLYAGNASEALDICENREIDVGLLITDVVMPGMNGVELAEQLKRLYPAMRVLFMSGFADDVIKAGSVQIPERLLLQKPFKEDSLVRKIRTIFAC